MEKSWNCVFEFLWKCRFDETEVILIISEHIEGSGWTPALQPFTLLFLIIVYKKHFTHPKHMFAGKCYKNSFWSKYICMSISL